MPLRITMTTPTHQPLVLGEGAHNEVNPSALPLTLALYSFTWCPVIVEDRSPQVLLREPSLPYQCQVFNIPALGLCAQGANMKVCEGAIINIETLSLVGWRIKYASQNVHEPIVFKRTASRMHWKIQVRGVFRIVRSSPIELRCIRGKMQPNGLPFMSCSHNQNLREATENAFIADVVEQFRRHWCNSSVHLGDPPVHELSGLLGQNSSHPVTISLYGRGSISHSLRANTYTRYPVEERWQLSICSIDPLRIVVISKGGLYFSQGTLLILDGAVTLLDGWKQTQCHRYSSHLAISFECRILGEEHLLEVHHIQRRHDDIKGKRIALWSSVLLLRSRSLSNPLIEQVGKTEWPQLRGRI